MHECNRDISTYPQRICLACYLISRERFATLLRRTTFKNSRDFLPIKSVFEGKESNLCAIIRLAGTQCVKPQGKKRANYTVEKLLPQNIEAECGVLGSIIIDPEAIVQVSDFLHADDFYRDAHHTIYEVILQLYEEHEPADFITICDELERRNRLEEVGGASYITSLVNQVPTSGNVEFYARIVERTAILRH